MTANLVPDWWDSHTDGLCLFGDLPEGEEQRYLLTLFQKLRLRGGLGFQESLQSLDSFLHLKDALQLT